MSSISVMGVLLGLVFGTVPALYLVAPEKTGEALRRFSRNRIAGMALAALDLLWSGWIVYHAELGTFNAYKPLLFGIVPVAFGLVVWAIPELLAARALGGLFLLVPSPILMTIRWEDSWVRLILAGLCYVVVITGMTLVMSPFRFRTSVEWVFARAARARTVAVAVVVVAAGVAVLGFLLP
jgi:hypothetical protein